MATNFGKTVKGTALLSAALILGAGMAFAEGKVEVMHWWTSGGEANALNVVKDALKADGVDWVDSAVAGGSGTNALQVLQARVAAGDPPAAMQMHGQQLLEYGTYGILGDLNDVATAENWDAVMDPALQPFAKQNGVYVGVPINVHRHNWMWGSKKLVDQYGGKMPTTWDEFFAIADKMKADGIQPLAHGGQPWQEFMLWEDAVLSIGGVDYHKAALGKLDPEALKSDTMVQSFDLFRKILGYADEGASNRDWNLATAMVIEDQAAFQFMGDWAKGEFSVANKQPGVDYICAPAPGTAGTFVFLADFWGFFPVKDEGSQATQKMMAKLTMDPAVQLEFNIRKGSIPARMDADTSKLDMCGQAAVADRVSAQASGNMIPSLAQNHAQQREVRGVFEDVITSFANNPEMTSAEAVQRIADGIAGL